MENMVRPENMARLTVTHRPTMFTYRDLKARRQKVGFNGSAPPGVSVSSRGRWCAHILACPSVLQEM